MSSAVWCESLLFSTFIFALSGLEVKDRRNLGSTKKEPCHSHALAKADSREAPLKECLGKTQLFAKYRTSDLVERRDMLNTDGINEGFTQQEADNDVI